MSWLKFGSLAKTSSESGAPANVETEWKPPRNIPARGRWADRASMRVALTAREPTGPVKSDLPFLLSERALRNSHKIAFLLSQLDVGSDFLGGQGKEAYRPFRYEIH